MKQDNNEKIFYILINDEKKGPFSLNDLKDFELRSDTLLWYYNLPEWKKISEINDLKEELKFHLQPPNNQKENSLDDIESNKIENENLIIKKISIIEIQFFIGWIAFHLFALLTSNSGVVGFNERGYQSSEVIWPFFSGWSYCKGSGNSSIFCSLGDCEKYDGVVTYNGVFTFYDITDFLLYVGASIFLMIFIYIKRANKQ